MRRRNIIKSSTVLALIFCLFSVVGAMAQGSIKFLGPEDGDFSAPASHNGVHSIRLTVGFTPPPNPKTFSIENFTATPVDDTSNIDDLNFTPMLRRLEIDPTNEGIWRFSLRPIGKAAIELGIRVDGITDKNGNGYRPIPAGTVRIKYKPLSFGLVAEAGPNQGKVASGELVTLDGTGSTLTGGGRDVTYLWARTGGTTGGTVTLTGDTTLAPSFTADTLTAGDDDVEHIITLTVMDNQGNPAATDTVTITVNAPPLANAGDPQRLRTGGPVTLDGGDSMDSDGTITYSWVRTGGTTGVDAKLTGPNTETPSFTADTPTAGAPDVTHVFTLTVTDKDGATDEDMVTITVNAPPLANAGLDRVVASTAMVVTLDGSDSSDSTGTTYAWVRSLAPDRGNAGTVTLNGAKTNRPTFTPVSLDPGAPDATYGFTLTVTDSDGVTAVDMVEITVTSGLFAQAGEDQSVGSGATVTLDGSGSTRTDRTVTYAWTRASGTTAGGTGSAVTLSDPSAVQPTFTAQTLTPGATAVTYIFTLTVTDNVGSAEATDTVTITVNAPPFAALVADAGLDQDNVGSGTQVTLDGSGSTPTGTAGGRTVTYAWTPAGGTGSAVTLSDPSAVQPTFTAQTLTPGATAVTYIFTLTVTDNVGSAEATDTVTITVTAPDPFADPVANAGPHQTVASGATVTLDGSKSTKDDRRTIDYLWARTGGTPGKSVTLTGSNTAEPSFTADTLEPEDPDVTHVFTLTVTDDADETATDTVMVTVTAVLVNIRVYPSDLTVQEGGSGTYQVSLSESPRRKVSVIAFLDHEDVVLENARLEFNAENWDTRQDVRINTVADADKVDDTARIRHRLADGVAFGQAEIVTVRVRDEDPILRPIGNYLASRATALLNNQPELIRFLKQDETDETTQGRNFTLKATGGRLAMNGGFVHDGVWGEVTGSYGNSDSGDTKSVLGSVGIQRKYSENLLVGAMLQFDLSDHDLAGNIGRIDGTVWLVGPYFAARHGSQPLYFEGRLLYGESDNDIRLIDRDLGVRTGSFDTTQLLAQIRVEGEIALSDRDEGPQLIPYADARWIEDRAEAFTDRIGNRFVNRVPGQKVSTGQLELGSNVEIPVAVNHGEMTLTGGLGLVYANTEGDYITSDSRGRGRGEIGFSYVLDDNVRIDFESFYDGIGTSRYEGYGLSLSVEMKF